MKYDKKIYLSGLYIIIGIMLFVLGGMAIVDEFWVGCGSALFVIGILQFIRHVRYRTNDTYRENIDIEISDERNRFLRMKAWSWAGYLFIITCGVGTIIFKLLGREDIMMAASFNVCFLMILFWISFYCLKLKY